jgi:hypothetical protein
MAPRKYRNRQISKIVIEHPDKNIDYVDRLFKKLSTVKISTYFKTRLDRRNTNPLSVKMLVCVCANIEPCSCVRIVHLDKKDTKHAVSAIIYGDSLACDNYVFEFNKTRREHINDFHNMLRVHNSHDKAFQLIAISHAELFHNCNDLNSIPQEPQKYNAFVETVFQNMVGVFHRDVGNSAYLWATDMFKAYNCYDDSIVQVEPYITPSWDMFGSFDSAYEEDIKLMRFSKGDYRYYSGSNYSRDLNNRGFLSKMLELFYENGRLVPDRKIILQITIPDGSWIETKNGLFMRYSDIQIGFSAKGKIRKGENSVLAASRELNEEIDLQLTKEQVLNIVPISNNPFWGRIEMLKFDITDKNIIPVNPFKAVNTFKAEF